MNGRAGPSPSMDFMNLAIAGVQVCASFLRLGIGFKCPVGFEANILIAGGGRVGM